MSRGVASKVCGANKRSGGVCQKPAGWGTKHRGTGSCKLHGGSTRSGNLSAVKEEMRVMGEPVQDLQPHEALIYCVRLTAGEVQYCEMIIQEIRFGDAIVRPEVEKVEDYETEEGAIGTHTSTTKHKEEMNLWFQIRRDAVDRLAKYSKMALDAGVEERRVQLAENWGEDIARLLKGILGDLKLSPKQKERAPEIIRTHLLSLESASAMKLAA